ncbi:MAG: hypothetical protein PSX37_04700 [bacterium]|nr:hypothetical protein [bacterium]
MGIYSDLGLDTVVNAVGPATRLGGLPLSDGVLDAMRQAVESNVRMDELEEAAGIEIARLLGVPAVYVTSGASAALTLAAAVCAVGSDPGGVDHLPRTSKRTRILIQSAHRDPYDRAVTAVGLSLSAVGFPGSTRPQELLAELDETVAAVLWRPGRGGDLLSLATVSDLAHRVGAAVIVDAAMDVPPLARLHQMLDDGADLVAISGGKAFRGPHTSGLLCGTPDLVYSVALHHQDMDIREGTWQPSSVTGAQLTRGRHGIGRGMKVGREQIAGLLVAIREYLADPDTWADSYARELCDCREALAPAGGVVVLDGYERHLDVPVLEVDFTNSSVHADEVVRQLALGSPRIHVGEDGAWQGVLTLNPMGIKPGEGTIIGRRIVEIVAQASKERTS